MMRITYDGPDFGLGKQNNKRIFGCLVILADQGLLNIDGDTGLGWIELPTATDAILELCPKAGDKPLARRLWL